MPFILTEYCEMANYTEPIFDPIYRDRDLLVKRHSTASISSNKIESYESSSHGIGSPKSLSSNRGNPFLNNFVHFENG